MNLFLWGVGVSGMNKQVKEQASQRTSHKQQWNRFNKVRCGDFNYLFSL